MVSNKEAKEILTKIAHCPLAWWYWHWVEKGYTQGTIASLLNSFESEAAENQKLDQVKEEFGSDLSDNEVDEVTETKTTIEIGMMQRNHWQKKMKEKDYDIEGVNSRSSKRTHQTNMTGKTGCTSMRSVTTKKFAMNFK
jgi:hypothetical protein